MAVSPVETISMVPKSQEASFMKQSITQKPIVEQQLMSDKMNSEIKHNTTQTVPTNKSSNPEYRYDAKEKSNNSYSGNQKKQNKNNSKKDKNKNSSSHDRIDIRI